MSDLMLRRGGNATPDGNDRRRYRALQLGRSGGDTLLTELLPYPHPKASDWLYARFGKFCTRDDYKREMIPHRSRLLRGVLSESPREYRESRPSIARRSRADAYSVPGVAT
jgi:hypothetical protein